jgi:hypothetical protein
MCYNCGCLMPDNDMGNSENITDETFKKAAEASGQTVKEAMENTRELIDAELAKAEQGDQ